MSKEDRKHTKHTALVKPIGGDFHSNEWSIIGAPCDVIHKLASEISIKLKKYKVGYIDADHNASKKEDQYHLKYSDKISFQQINMINIPKQKQYRKYFNDLDLLLVNGNHFKGDQQIVIINEKKRDSLNRKLDRLTNVKMILLDEGEEEIYDFIKDIVIGDVPILKISQIEEIADYIISDFNQSIPLLNGLVFAGGKSKRMGRDKGEIDYKGKPHRVYTADMLSKVCSKVYLSCREDQEGIDNSYSIITDTFSGLGPYSGILSAFREQPNHAWLTVACDLPLLDDEQINKLVDSRNPSKLATCFYNPETEFPEPLITIWEPRAYPVLLEFLSQGYSCPRKVLINSDIELIKVDDVDFMLNVNDQETYRKVIKELS